MRVNGRVVTELGTKVDAHKDRVEVDGRRVVGEKPVYYLLHKDRETVTTLSDPEGRATIADSLRGIVERVFPVGRLDYHTTGALLITNDGEMADALLRPRAAVPKVYVAKVSGHIDDHGLEKLRNGIRLDDGYTTNKADVFVIREEGKNTWLQLTLTEGKNRQVHRMFEALGRRVMRLSRQSFAGLQIEGLRPGEARELTGDEIRKLKKKFLTPYKRSKR